MRCRQATPSRRIRAWLGGGLLVMAALVMLDGWSGVTAMRPATAALNLLFTFYVPVALVRGALSTERVDTNVIAGALCGYVFLGFAWGFTYTLIEQLAPGSFSTPDALSVPGAPLFYFSFTTLTTLGYGDIAPVSGTARALAITEALTGQIFLVVIVARLVALQIAPRNAR